ncbi:MAG: hypothetical protein KDA31_08195 [Phycisphaerales bacterium]|nr:hypothetical protein [Phycisphaerales bacterium]MCB9835890.1 hypothetical protein [Phycisphaera sp.]
MLAPRFVLVSMALGLSSSSGLAEPVSSSLTIERVATVENMGRMAVNPATGEIAFGRTGPGASDAFAVRVLGADWNLREVGAPIRDPDAVVWDMDGSFGPAGSILVGSFKGLFAVTPSGGVHQFAWRGEDLANPEDMVMGDDGSLYYADYTLGRVMRLSMHGSFAELMDKPGVNRVAIDANGHVEAVDVAGLLSTAGLAPQGRFSEIAFGDGSALWGDDRYVFDSDAGSLLRLLGDGSSEVLATGFFDELAERPDRLVAQIGFMPSGEMVVSVPDTGAVYTLVPAPGAATLAGLGAVLAVKRKR